MQIEAEILSLLDKSKFKFFNHTRKVLSYFAYDYEYYTLSSVAWNETPWKANFYDLEVPARDAMQSGAKYHPVLQR